MEDLGLECCEKDGISDMVYDLLEFAYLRRYVLASDAFVVNVHTLHVLQNRLMAENNRLNEKYTKEYGSKEKWTVEIFAKYDDDRKKELEKYGETASKIIVKALMDLSKQERVVDYIKYINVFFGKEEKDRLEEY